MADSSQGQPPTPEELERLLAGGASQEVQMIASEQIIVRRFNFDVQPTGDGGRVLVLTTVLPSGVPLVERCYPFQNPENADALGKRLCAPSITLPGQNGSTHA